MPTMMPNKPPKVPITVRNHPFYKNQRRQLSRNKVDFTKPQTAQYNRKPNNHDENRRNINNNTDNAEVRTPTRLQTLSKTTLDTIYEEDETQDTDENHGPLQLNGFEDEDIPELCLNAIYKLLKTNNYELNTAKLLLEINENKHTTKDSTKNENENNNDVNKNKLNEAKKQTQGDTNTIESLILNAKVLKDGHISLTTLREEQENDLMINNIRTKDPMPKQYFYKKGFLLAKINGNERIVIPETLFKQLSYQYHHSLLGLHQTPDTMLRRIAKVFYHPLLKTRLQHIYDSCLVCRSERNRKSRLQTFGEKTIPTQSRQTWQFDVCCGLPSGQCKYIFLFTDITTCFSVHVPSPTREAHRIQHAFENHVVKIFGAKTIFSDREPGILSGIFQNYCLENNIKPENTPGYSPWDSGIVESHVSYTKQLIRLYNRTTGISHNELINILNKAMNTRLLTNVTKGGRTYTPELLMFGSTLHQIPELLTEENIFTDRNLYYKYLVDNTQHMMHDFLQQRKITADRIRANANKKRTIIEYNAGDIVYCRNSRIAEIEGGALQVRYDGPYEILEINNRHCRLRDIASNVEKMAHSQNLKKMQRADIGTIIPDKIKHQQLTRNATNYSQHTQPTNQDTNTTRRQSTRINDPNYTHKVLTK